ncbi:MFS transporter [Purpureocillium lavendulum]|uniref:MFS transporter n=1 Tax=Purpureocillium lavendulum TaxID=1247861 RepID=A0AB34FED9_9HYPO|nr:MFS transporter [Purpureocillium lavendulum]
MQANVNARIHRQMNHSLFTGIVLDLDNHATATLLTTEAAVKGMWPIERLSLSPNMVLPSRGPNGGLGKREQSEHGCRSAYGRKTRLRGKAKSNRTKGASSVPHRMMQIDQLHNQGITGKGSRIAIIDTGVDYEHPALGGCFGPGCPVSFGADLVHNEPTPMDCFGHGTFIAGLIAAQNNDIGLVGAAPGAELGMYRISIDGRLTTTDIMIAAIYRAYDDGATIISSSFGMFGLGWADTPIAEAASRVTSRGVVYVQAAGNDGEQGAFTTLDPAGSPDVISVGSISSTTYRPISGGPS